MPGPSLGQDFERSGANLTIFYFFRPSLRQVFSGPEQVWGKFLVVLSKYEASFLTSIWYQA